MIGQSLAHMDISALQKAVLGMDPAIKPYAALAALQEKVKSEQMKQGQALQNPAQPPVAQQMMAQAQQLSPAQVSSPYMAAGLGAAPVQSPVQEPATGMASGGIVAFDEGGEVPRFDSGGSPASRFFSNMEQDISNAEKTARLRNQLLTKYGPASDISGLFMQQSDEERQTAKAVAAALPKLSLTQLQQLAQNGPSALTGVVTKPAASPAPASTDNRPYTERNLAASQPAPGGIAENATLLPPAPVVKPKAGLGAAAAAATPTEKTVAGLGQTDQASKYDVTPQYKTVDEFLAARKNAEKNTDVLPEDEYSKTLRQNLTKREERLAQAEKKGDQMAYLQAAGAFFGPGNLAQNASRAIPMFAEAKMKANSALEAAQEKATDAQDAWARYNQARQDGNKKDAREAFKDFNAYTTQAKQLQLTGQHYRDTAEHYVRADRTSGRMADAANTAANNRGLGGAFGADKQRLAELKVVADDLRERLKDPSLRLPRNAAQKATLTKQLDQINGTIAGMAGLNTIPETTLSPGAGGPPLAPLNSFYNK